MKRLMATIAAASIAAPLYAQEVSVAPLSATVAPDNAFEVTLGAGYAQGFGDLGAGQQSLTDLASAGGELQLGLGWRINPRFMVGVYGTGSSYATRTATSGANIWTATAGVQGNYHFLPMNEWDPWIGLSSGWRGMWISNGGTDSRNGLDIAKLTAGVDYRVSSQFAVSPYASVGLTTFLTQQLAGQNGFSNVRSPDVNVWLAAGIQGRFDMFEGGSSLGPRVASND